MLKTFRLKRNIIGLKSSSIRWAFKIQLRLKWKRIRPKSLKGYHNLICTAIKIQMNPLQEDPLLKLVHVIQVEKSLTHLLLLIRPQLPQLRKS